MNINYENILLAEESYNSAVLLSSFDDMKRVGVHYQKGMRNYARFYMTKLKSRLVNDLYSKQDKFGTGYRI